MPCLVCSALRMRSDPDRLSHGYNTSIGLNVGNSITHNRYLLVEKTSWRFIQHKTLDSTFKVGREGSDKCLSFLHIPKNAGTAIEGLVLKATDASLRHWGMFDTSLDCYDSAPDGEWPSCFFTSKGADGQSTEQSCSKWHVPPHLDSKLAASYTYDGCETFCVVRHPETRFSSGVRHWCPTDSPERLNQRTKDIIDSMALDRYQEDCHFVSQTEYVYGDANSPQYCTHQVRFEHLKEDFENLMQQFDIPLALETQAHPGNPTEDCKWDGHFDELVHAFATEYYSHDFKNFNYSALLVSNATLVLG